MPGLRLSPGTWARGGRISRVKWGGEKMIWAGSLLFIVIIFHSTDATQHWFHYKYWSTSESAGGKEGKGLCVFLDQWTLSLAFKQNIHIGKLTNVVSSIGVVTQNISISALQWISRLRSEVSEWWGVVGLDFVGRNLCLVPLSHFNWGNCSGAVLSISSSQMKAWRHYQYPILHFDRRQM